MQDSKMQESATTQSSDPFRPVQGGGETTSATAMLVSAYIVLWVILFGFVLLTYRRQQALSKRIEDLGRALERSQN